ncbi:hypothetical protein C2E23DRAFT_745123 [Lenzites betulinus]|nr:hypothetical protein C2E23DRAFT_745123 [Lenzites betulinus]
MEFSIEQLSTLQATIERLYPSWWRNAPQVYKHPLLDGRIPAAVVLKYGQDRQVCAPPTANADAALWDHSCDYSKLARVAFALATHYRVSPVRDWTPIDPDVIRNAHPTIYTTPDPETREEVEDLEQYPLVDDDDREIQVFAPNGRRIPRHSVSYFEPYEPCSVLQNLGQVSQLFAAQPSHDNRWTYNDDGAVVRDRGPANAEEVEVDAILDGIDPPSVHLYPLGFTRHGQWQANGVIDPLRRHISAISRSLKLHDGGGPAVEPIKSQCYNNIAHYTRHSARHHIAQRGVLTGTTGGAWAKTTKARATASTLYAACSRSNPHSDLCGQLERAEQTFLRFENVYTVHCQRLPEDDRTGREFYLKVMMPLTGACAHPTVLDAIKNTSTVFRPGVFPNLMLWTTYPVRVLLELFWQKVSPALIVGSNATPNPVDLELIAILERLVNFAHTGAMKVLTTGVMDRLWPSRAIVDHGFPCFSPALFLGGDNGLLPSVDLNDWPIHSITGYPLVASKRALEITYGNAHFTTYHTLFHIHLKVSNAVRVAGDSQDILAYRIKVMGSIVAAAFVNDVKAFVKDHTLQETQDAIDDPTHIDHDFAVIRRRSLKTWIKSSQPLNYGTNKITFADLVRTVSAHPDDVPAGLPPSSTRSTSLEAFVDKIYSWAVSATVSPRAPLYKDGTTGIVLRTIIAEATRVLRGHSPTERSAALKRLIVRALTAAQVHFMPDARPNPARHGSPSHQPSIHAWTTLGAAPQARSLNPDNARTHTERVTMELNASARILEDSDVRGDWAFDGLQIQHIHSVLNRIVTPIDWASGAAGKTAKGCSADIYKWAVARFTDDMQHWTCSLALSLAVLLTRTLPKVFYPRPIPKPLLKLITTRPLSKPNLCIAAIRSIPPSHPSTTLKGLSDTSLYATQAAIWLLAWIDESSPLRIAIKNGNISDIKDFTAKHGQNHINLIRLGIAYGSSARLFGAARVNQDYYVLPTPDLVRWAAEVKTKLTDLPHGPFTLTSTIFGLQPALDLRDQGQFPGMDPATVTSLTAAAAKESSIASSSKHSLDISDDISILPQQRRRHN